MIVKIADVVFDIKVNDPKIRKFFSEYICDDVPNHKIVISDDDIAYEQEHGDDIDKDIYSCELLAIYRKILVLLVEHEVVEISGSAFVCNRLGILIAGKRGAGKTSHLNLYAQNKKIEVINDDKPLVKYENDKFVVYGNPFSGNNGLGSNIKHSLDRICIIRQSKINSICEVSEKAKYETLFNIITIPKNIDARILIIDLAKKMCAIKTYTLYCDLSKDAFEVSYEAMCKTK